MKRFAAHYIALGKRRIINKHKQHYLELDENNLIKGVFPLEKEIAGTVFCNGILFPVSMELKLKATEILDTLQNLSRQHPDDSVFQILQRSGFVCEDLSVPVQIFQLDGVDLVSMEHNIFNHVFSCLLIKP